MIANDNAPTLPLAEVRRDLAARLAAVDAILDALPDRADDLVAAMNRSGADGLKAFLADLGHDTARRVLAALGFPANVMVGPYG